MLVALDTSVLLAWLNAEDTSPGLRLAVSEMMRVAESDKEPRKYQFVVSSVVLGDEVQPRQRYERKYAHLREVIELSPGFHIMNRDISVDRKAEEVRRVLSVRDSSYPSLDAVHVATAILSGARYLCTLDRGDMLNRKAEIMNLSLDRKLKVVMPQGLPGISRAKAGGLCLPTDSEMEVIPHRSPGGNRNP